MTRGSDVVARIGGDEFIILLPNTPYGDACEFSERLHDYLMNHPLITDAGASIPVSMSFGVSCLDDRLSDDLDSLLQRADKMLYQIKKHKAGIHSGS
jgi:diguanylate cyclase (GGDEF)-like protein